MAKQTYAQRIERGMVKYLAANPGATAAEAKRAARGHAHTPEHGIARDVVNNQAIISFRDADKAEQAFRMAEREEGRAKLIVEDKDGNVRELFSNGGHGGGISVDYLREQVEELGLDGVIEEELASTSGGRGAGVFNGAAIRSYQIIVL